MLLKRIGVTICVCLIVLFSVPSIPAYAYDGDYVMYLPNSYNLYDGVLSAQSKLIIGNSSNLSNFVQDKFDSINSFMQSNYSNYDIMHYSGSPSDSGEGYLHIFDGVTNGRVFFYSASQSSTASYQNCVLISDTPFTFSYRRVNNNGSTIGSSPAASPFYQCGTCVYNGNTYYFAGDNTNFYSTYQYNGQVTFNNTSYASDLQHGTGSVNLRYSSFPVYTAYEDSTIPTSGFLYFKDIYKILEGSFTPINDPVNAFTSSGVVEDYDTGILPPEVVIESNQNHLYFRSVDLGFAEPTNINSFSSFGGAYVYCNYSVDDWVVNHISDYSLQFNTVSVIGQQQNNFSYTVPLDRNGLVTIPFTDMFSSNNSSSAVPINSGFVAVIGSQKLGNDYNVAHLYSVANENVPNFVRKLDSEYNYNLVDLGWSALRGGELKYIVSWVTSGGTKSLNSLASWSETVVQSFNPFILRIQVKLVTPEGESGDYAEKFDLYTGDQTTVATGGLVNPDPFVPEIDPGEGDTPLVPEDPNSTTIIPGGSGNTNISIYGSGNIGFDPGYRELKQDIDADPSGNFTAYLDPLKNDSFGEWFLSFINAFPPELKVLLISGSAAGVGFGIYRFVRRG